MPSTGQPWRADLQPSFINNAAWSAVVPNLTAQLGSTWGQYVQQLDNDSIYFAGLGEPTTDVSQLLSFEIEKANAAYSAPTAATITAVDLPAPGMDLSFTLSFQAVDLRPLHPGIVGLGWTTNWDSSASTQANGDVAIEEDGATVLYFSLQPDGAYQSGGQRPGHDPDHERRRLPAHRCRRRHHSVQHQRQPGLH